jgi:hypothetical protein
MPLGSAANNSSATCAGLQCATLMIMCYSAFLARSYVLQLFQLALDPWGRNGDWGIGGCDVIASPTYK